MQRLQWDGSADSGGTHPWGEPILIRCHCTYPTTPQRTWDELTLAEVKEAYNQHAKYQIEDMGASGWVEFADALQTILRSKNT